MVGVSIAEAASLAKAALEAGESGGSTPSFVDFSTELPWEGFAMDAAEGKLGIGSCKMSTENQITLLDADTLDEIIRFPITFPCTKLLFNKQDTSLFAASSDALRIWRHDALAGIQRVAKLQTHSQAPPLTGFDWDERIAISSADGQVHVFDVEKAAVISSLVVHEGSALDVAFKAERSPSTLATAGKDGCVKLLDTRDASRATTLFKLPGPALRVQWQGSGSQQLACFGLDSSEILILDERRPNEVLRRLDHPGSCPTAMSSTGEFLISGCSDGRLFMFSRGGDSAVPDAALDQGAARFTGSIDGLKLLNDKTAVVVSKRVIRIFSI